MRRIQELATAARYGFNTLTDDGYFKPATTRKNLCVLNTNGWQYSPDYEVQCFEELCWGNDPAELAESVVTTSKHVLRRHSRRTTTFAVVAADKAGLARKGSKVYLFHTTQRVNSNGALLVSVTWDPTVRVHDKDVRGFLSYLRDLCKARNEMLCAGSPESYFWE